MSSMLQLERSEDYAEAMKVLSKPERLELVSYLEEESQTTLNDLSEYMESLGHDNAYISLVHHHIPILDEHGVVESEDDLFDDEEQVKIEYIGDEVIEEVIGTLEEL